MSKVIDVDWHRVDKLLNLNISKTNMSKRISRAYKAGTEKNDEYLALCVAKAVSKLRERGDIV